MINKIYLNSVPQCLISYMLCWLRNDDYSKTSTQEHCEQLIILAWQTLTCYAEHSDNYCKKRCSNKWASKNIQHKQHEVKVDMIIIIYCTLCSQGFSAFILQESPFAFIFVFCDIWCSLSIGMTSGDYESRDIMT